MTGFESFINLCNENEKNKWLEELEFYLKQNFIDDVVDLSKFKQIVLDEMRG